MEKEGLEKRMGHQEKIKTEEERQKEIYQTLKRRMKRKERGKQIMAENRAKRKRRRKERFLKRLVIKQCLPRRFLTSSVAQKEPLSTDWKSVEKRFSKRYEAS